MTAEVLYCGIDEVGLGCWAGPICAGAVILQHPIAGLDDSKRLSPRRRQEMRLLIENTAIAAAVGWAGVAEITCLGLLRANHLAMRRAYEAMLATLSVRSAPIIALIDGLPHRTGPDLSCTMRHIVRGDQTEACISAASILAKTSRDAYMCVLDVRYPGYGFAQNKGYGVKAHAVALDLMGPSPVHRPGFKPVAVAAAAALRRSRL